MHSELKIDLLLSLGRSLWNEAPDSLRAAAVSFENYALFISYFFNVEIPDIDKEDLDSAATQVFADFSTREPSDIFFIRKDFPESLPLDVGIYSFSRDTPIQRQINRSETTHLPLFTQAKLSLYQALLGRINPALQRAGIVLTEGGFDVCFCVSSNATLLTTRILTQVSNEVIADFPELEVHIKIKPFSFPRPDMEYVFARKGTWVGSDVKDFCDSWCCGGSIFILDRGQANAILRSKNIKTWINIVGEPGEAGAKEKVDFGEVIGYHVNEKTKERTETMWGIVVYTTYDRFYIVPTLPDS